MNLRICLHADVAAGITEHENGGQGSGISVGTNGVLSWVDGWDRPSGKEPPSHEEIASLGLAMTGRLGRHSELWQSPRVRNDTGRRRFHSKVLRRLGGLAVIKPGFG